MQAPPPFEMHVRHAAAWRIARASISLCAAAAVAAWCASGAATESVMSAVMLGLACAAVATSFCFRRRDDVCALRWDGQCWHLAARAGDATPAPEQAGQVRVAMDIGVWMLLRWRAADGSGRRWVAVQRPGHRAAWHSLRCTAHGSQGADAPGSGRH